MLLKPRASSPRAFSLSLPRQALEGPEAEGLVRPARRVYLMGAACALGLRASSGYRQAPRPAGERALLP